MTAVTEKRVNAALARAGVPIEVWTQKGYRSVRTLDPAGPEVDSIYICYWHELTLEGWVAQATANYERVCAERAADAVAVAADAVDHPETARRGVMKRRLSVLG